MKNNYTPFKRFLLAILFLLIGSISLFAQPGTATYINNTGATANAFPFNTTANIKIQWIYVPGAFTTLGGGAGTPAPGGMAISKIYIKFSSTVNATTVYPNFTISLGQNLGTQPNWGTVSSTTYPFTSGLTTCFFQASGFQFTGNVANAWYGITLQTPFPYDPSLSLIVEAKSTLTTAGGNGVANVTTALQMQRLYGGNAATTGTSNTGLTPVGFDLIPSGACTNPITIPGTSTATPSTPVCTGTSVALNVAGGATGSGMTYQWFSDPSIGGSYTTAVSGVLSSPAFNITPSTTLYYRCQEICSAGTPANSTPVLVTVNPAFPGGTYTINSAVATGGTNFQTFTAAVAAISCGIAGPVIFNVDPASGPYTEQITIPVIGGASATNTITFNGNGRTLQFASADANNRHVIKLDGADYITIDNLKIVANTGTYGWGVHFMNGADFNTISNCSISVSTTDIAVSVFHCLVMSNSVTTTTTSGNNGNFNTIINDTLIGGYYTMVLYGNSAVGAENLNNKVKNCVFKDSYAYTLYMAYQKNDTISNNDFSRPTRTASTTTAAVFLTTGNVNTLVEKNRVHNYFDAMTTNASTCYSFYVAADGTSALPNRYINNLVYQMNGNGPLYGIYNSTAAYLLAYHNTIAHDYTAATLGTTYGFYQTGVTTGIEYKNNNIYITRGGTGAKVGINLASASTIISNNNIIYLNSAGTGTQNVGNYVGTNYATMANWQTANSNAYDQQSISTDPLFVSPGTGNYTPGALLADNVGVNVGVANDILGTIRSVTTPDAGAYEFTISAGLDIGAFSLVTPVTTDCFSNVQTVVIRIKNYGGFVDFSATPATITCNITGAGSATLTGTPTGTLAINGTMDVTLTGTFDMSTNGVYTFNAFTTSASDGNASNDAMVATSRTRTAIVAGTVSANQKLYCISGSPIITLTGSSGGNIQWQQSTTGISGPWSNVGTGTNTYLPGVVTQTFYYRAFLSCVSATDSTNVDTITVNNPSVITTNSPVSLCGTGTVILTANVSAGATANWYSASTGGSPLFTGTSFTTPVISSPTSYWVGASSGGGTANLGLPNRVGATANSGFADIGLMFDAFQAFTLQSVAIYPTATTPSGNASVTIALKNSAGTILQSTTVSVPTSVLPGIKTTVPLNFAVPVGVQHRLVVTAATGGGITGLIRESSTGYVYPYTVPGVASITSAYTGGASASFYYYFYDWLLSTGCESPRTQVLVNQFAGPTISATHTQTVICSGGTDNLNVTSANPGYKYTWTPGSITGASVIVNPVATTVYTVTAVDTTTGTFATCVATATVTVATLPSSVTINGSPQAICGSSGSSALSLSPSTGYAGGSIQWQDSPNDTTFTDIPAANGVTYTTPVLSATKYYRAVIKDAANNICLQPKKAIVVGTPTVINKKDSSRCGTGTIPLEATASAGASIGWFANPTGGSSLATGSPFITPTLSTTTTFYAQAETGGGASATTPVPAAGTPFSGNVRGYWFTAPVNFNITGLSTPLTGTAQSVAIIRFTGATPPPTFSVTTNAFTTLFISQNNPNTGVIPCNVSVNAGDVIGIFGQMTSGATNSSAYATPVGPLTTTIAGNTVTMTRMGMQFSLTTTAPQDVWQEPGAAIGRVAITYEVGCTSPRVPVIATVNPAPAIDAISLSPAVCTGGSTDVFVSSSNDPDYVYSWTSNPAGFSTLGAGPHTVTPAVTTTYIVSALDNSGGLNSGCTATDSVTVTTGTIAPGTISTFQTTLCQSGTPTITAIGSSGLRQWQQTSDTIAGPWINVGAGGTTFTPLSPITQTTYYRLRVSCDVTFLYSNIVKVTVQTPAIISTTTDTVCGSGAVTLSATSTPGSTIKWYANPSGGSPLATGGSYSTNVSATTNFYAEPSENGGNSSSALLITEMDLGTNDQLEITNVSATPLNLAGYKVAIGNSYTVITTVNANVQLLTGTLAPGATLTWTDLATAPNYWGSNMLWNPGAYPTFTGWAAILDGSNNLVDFVAMNWPSANIQGASVVIGAVTITVGTQWSGNGIDQTTVAATQSISRIGNSDNNNLSDFSIINLSIGAVNPGLTIPFAGLGCLGTRVPVAAVVSPPPAINVVSADPAVCAAGSTSVQVSSINDPGYIYTWTSIPPGFTNTGSGPFIVSPTVTTTYQVSAVDTSGPNNGCVATGNATVVTGPALIAGTASSSNLAFCVSGSPTLSLDASSGGIIQWQQSVVSAAGPWTNAVISPTYTPFLTQTTHFRAIVKCPGDSVISNVVTVLVTTPLVTGTTPDTRCGYGPVTLTASGNGSQLNWYNQGTGGFLMNTGSPFTTTVTSTDTFYVATQQNSFDTISPGFTGGTTATDPVAAGNMFNVHSFTELIINGFDINLNNNGSLAPSNISVYYKPGTYIGFATTAGAWTLAGSVSGVVSAGSGVPTYLPLAVNLTIPAGQTYGFYIVVTNLGVANSLIYNSSATSPAEGSVAVSNSHLELIAGTTVFGPFTGLPAAPINRMWNGRVRYSIGCESARVPVIATVTNPPVLTLSSGSSVCSNEVATLSVTSNTSNFNTYIWSPLTNLFQNFACTLPYTGQNLTTVYLKSNSPVDTTSYTCIANSSVSLCGNIAHTEIVVKGLPNVQASASAASVCTGTQDTLSVTVGGNAGSTTNIGLTATVTSSGGGASASGYGPELLNDNLIPACDIGSVTFNWGWVTSNGWYLYTWPTVQTIKKVVFFKSNRPFTTLNIETSVDGITYTPVVTGFAGSSTCSAGIVYSSVDSIILASPITTRYLRFNNIAGSNPNFREIQVYPPSAGPGLSFTWNPGNLSGSKVIVTPPLGLNTYVVTVYDSTSQCTTYDTVTVTGLTIPVTPVATTSSQCGYGVPTANVAGGSGTFLWYLAPSGGNPIPGESGNVLTNYAINTSTTFYVAEFNGACSSNRVAVQANVTQPDLVTAVTNPNTCSNANLVLSATKTGSSNTYHKYTWTATPVAGSGIPTTASGNPAIITPTANGTYIYTVIATDTVAHCSSIDTVIVNVISAPSISSVQASPGLICGNASPVTLTALTGSSTAGFANIGTQTTTISGNNGNPYRSGNTVGNQIRTQLLVLASELTAAGLSTGNITSLGFTTTTAAGTVINFSIKMGHTSATVLTTNFITTSMTTVFTQATFAPALGLNTHFFTTPFVWDGISNVIIDVCQENSVLGTTTVAAYTPGYNSNVHVAVVGGCSAATGTVVTTKPIMRFGGQVGGGLGAGTYNWQWSPGAIPSGNVATTIPGSTTTYTVTATDPLTGCTITGSATVQVTATVKPYVFPNDTILCTGEVISIVARDSGAYGGSWPAGTSFDFGFGPTPDSTFFVNGPGNYNVQVILPVSLGGCSQISPLANIVYNDSPVLFATSDSVNCFGTSTGFVSAQVFLGSPPYRFKYYNSAGTILRDITTSLTNDTLFNVPAGNYCVVVRDAINAPFPTPSCRSDSVCIVVDEPTLLTASEVHGVISCNGNTTSVTITAAGGTPPYSGAGTFTQSAGSQLYTVTDANGCTASVTVVLTQPAVLTVSTTPVNIPCAYVAANIVSTVAGGTPSYEYAWSNSAVTPNLSAVGAGSYTLTVTDAHGCSAISSTTVAPPGPLALVTTPVMPVCRGAATGSITLTVSGGMSAFTYLWNGGTTTQNRAGLAAGTYTVTVTDVNGCTKTKTTVITQPATTMLVNTSQTNVRCYGLATGVATASPAGGSTPYSYSWNTLPVKTTASITALTSGVYTCTVTDAIGCSKTAIITITQPTDITVFQTQINVTFPGGNNGSATVSVSGGTPGYTYSWNTVPVGTTATVTGLTAGTYKCTITDTKSCTKKVTFIITEPIARPGDSPATSLDIRAYPNPTSGVVMLSFNNLIEERFSIRVTDLTGRVLYEENRTAGKGLNEFMYDFTTFSKGVYFINVSAGNRSKVIRIVIE